MIWYYPKIAFLDDVLLHDSSVIKLDDYNFDKGSTITSLSSTTCIIETFQSAEISMGISQTIMEIYGYIEKKEWSKATQLCTFLNVILIY